jgi:hypothetical protein
MILKEKASKNEARFKHSQPTWKKIHAATEELQWIQQYVFIASLDKAASNASFICISHIRAQALVRLQGKDFAPCQLNNSWINPVRKAEQLFEKICLLLPEILHSPKR